MYLVNAIIAGALGIWGLEGVAMQAARIFFFVFLVLFVVSLIWGIEARQLDRSVV